MLNIDVRNSEATKKEDEEKIKQLVEQGVGFEQVNVTVKTALRGWLLEPGREVSRVRLG